MNQIDEQKSLVEYLEAALTAARKHLASDPEKITRIETELAEARAEFERFCKNFRTTHCGGDGSAQSSDLRTGSSGGFSAELGAPRTEPFFKTFLNNIKSLFVK